MIFQPFTRLYIFIVKLTNWSDASPLPSPARTHTFSAHLQHGHMDVGWKLFPGPVLHTCPIQLHCYGLTRQAKGHKVHLHHREPCRWRARHPQAGVRWCVRVRCIGEKVSEQEGNHGRAWEDRELHTSGNTDEIRLLPAKHGVDKFALRKRNRQKQQTEGCVCVRGGGCAVVVGHRNGAWL